MTALLCEWGAGGRGSLKCEWTPGADDIAGASPLLYTGTSFALLKSTGPATEAGEGAMEFLLSVDWAQLFAPQMSLPEILIRGTLIYLALCLLLRVVLKRQA